MEWLLGLMVDPNGSWGVMMTAMVAVNVALSGVAKGLEIIKDKTESKADDKAHTALLEIIKPIAKVVDWVAPRTGKR